MTLTTNIIAKRVEGRFWYGLGWMLCRACESRIYQSQAIE